MPSESPLVFAPIPRYRPGTRQLQRKQHGRNKSTSTLAHRIRGFTVTRFDRWLLAATAHSQALDLADVTSLATVDHVRCYLYVDHTPVSPPYASFSFVL